MNGLQTILLANNSLNSISLPRNVYTLDLSGCSFSKIPKLPRLDYLNKINMAHNNLTDLISLGWYVNLYEANFDDNKINFIPPSIKKLTRLSSLSLENNEL